MAKTKKTKKQKRKPRFGDEFFKATSWLTTKGEARNFFADLFTKKEIMGITRRWQAIMMLENEKTYAEIERRTHLSSATIARIAKQIRKGKKGYKLIMKRIE